MSIKDELLFLFGGYVLSGMLVFVSSILRKRAEKRVNGNKTSLPESSSRRMQTEKFALKATWISSRILIACVTLFALTPLAFSGGALGGLFMLLLLFVALPFTLIYAPKGFGEFRRLRGGNVRKAPLWPSALLSIGGLAFLLPGSSFLINALLYFTGLVHHVELRVSAVADRSTLFEQGMSTISGDYLRDGEWTHLNSSWWMDLFHDLPAQGQTIRVAITPLWPYPMIESVWSALFVFTLALMPVALGITFLYIALREYLKSRSPTSSNDV